MTQDLVFGACQRSPLCYLGTEEDRPTVKEVRSPTLPTVPRELGARARTTVTKIGDGDKSPNTLCAHASYEGKPACETRTSPPVRLPHASMAVDCANPTRVFDRRSLL